MTLVSVTPIWSDLIADGWGVNVHEDVNGSTYNTDWPACVNLLTGMGVRYLRGAVIASNSGGDWDKWTAAANAGLKWHGTLAQIGSSDAAIKSKFNNAVVPHPSWFTSFGVVNEPQNYGAGWAQRSIDITALLRSLIDAAGLSDIPLCGPSIKMQSPTAPSGGKSGLQLDFENLGSVVASSSYQNPGHHIGYYLTRGDYHVYPGPSGPNGSATSGTGQSTSMSQIKGWADACYGLASTYTTESGYNTGLNATTGGAPVDEATQAAYYPRMILAQVARGVKRTFIYEFMDEYANTSTTTDQTWSDHWGMVKATTAKSTGWTPKQSYYTMQAFQKQFSDPNGGHTYTPTPIMLSVDNPSGDIEYVVTQKANGATFLHVWRDQPLFSASGHTLTVSPVTVTYATTAGSNTVSVAGSVVTVALNTSGGGGGNTVSGEALITTNFSSTLSGGGSSPITRVGGSTITTSFGVGAGRQHIVPKGVVVATKNASVTTYPAVGPLQAWAGALAPAYMKRKRRGGAS